MPIAQIELWQKGTNLHQGNAGKVTSMSRDSEPTDLSCRHHG